MAYDANDAADKKLVDGLIKAAVEKAVADATEEHDTAVTGLKNKNRELLKKLSEAREGKGKPEDVAALEEQLEESKAQITKLNKDLTKATTKLEETGKQLAEEQKYATGLVVETELTNALTGAKVAPEFLPAVKALLGPQVVIKTEADGRKAFVGDKPLGEHVTAWSQGDQGKAFVSAAINGGAGAPGARPAGQQGKTQMTRPQFDTAVAANPSFASGFFKDGGTVVDAAA